MFWKRESPPPPGRSDAAPAPGPAATGEASDDHSESAATAATEHRSNVSGRTATTNTMMTTQQGSSVRFDEGPPTDRSAAAGSLAAGSLASAVASSVLPGGAAEVATDDADTIRLQSQRIANLEKELSKSRDDLQHEKAGKRKLYSSLVKLAQELRRTRAEASVLENEADYANKRWYEGGIWRPPQLLPGIAPGPADRKSNVGAVMQMGGRLEQPPPKTMKDAVSLTDLFLDLVIVTGMTRVGNAVAERGTVDGPVVAYFAIFWQIWGKEASYSTRFDTTDLSSQVEALLTCFAVLFGCLSCTETFNSIDATRMMMVAASVAILHFFLHLRVACMYKGQGGLEAQLVRRYAHFIMAMTFLEATAWILGILFWPLGSPTRWVVFLVGIVLALRVPKAFLANDFHAAKSKRGVLFILLLGFTLQSVIVVATPFFDYQTPSIEQYLFLGSTCFLLFCIKLLYVDDTYSVDPQDHALLVSRTASFFFHLGQFCLLLSMTVLGSGLDLLTHSFLAATAALPDNAKNLVCGGFAAVILSIAFIKSMHLRRVPTNRMHEKMFFLAYGIQIIVTLTIAYVAARMCMNDGYFAILQRDEIEMLLVLSGAILFLVVISWLDEGVELSLYKGQDARAFRVHPFGVWWCLRVADENEPPPPPGMVSERMSLLAGSLSTSNLGYEALVGGGSSADLEGGGKSSALVF